MAERMIKHRLFTWFEETESPALPGTKVLTERIAHLGQVIDLPAAAIARGEQPEIDAFFTSKERKEIETGTYRGNGADAVYRMRDGAPAVGAEDISVVGEGALDVSSASDEEIAAYITENKLSVDKTLALVPEDADNELLEKFWDAENIASDNAPRKGVTDTLDARMHANVQA